MASVTDRYAILFPEDFDERAEHEMRLKGWFGGVVVELQNGSRFELTFFDPVRMHQELSHSAQTGNPYFAEPNLVILPEVTSESIHKAVEGLVRDKFFEHLKPL